MLFSNAELDINDLPKAESVSYQPLDSRYHSLLIIESVIFICITSVIAAGLLLWNPLFDRMFFAGLLLILTAVICGFRLWAGLFAWRYKGYALREKDLFYKTGIWFRKNTVMAFHRVQHIEIHQGPLERLFGISSLTLFTAGGGSSDLTIPGLHPETASKLKNQILKTSGFDEEE